MKISVQILLEELNYNYEIYNSAPENQTYEWVRFLPERVAERDSAYIYVCRLSEALERNDRLPGECFICLRDRIPDQEESDRSLEGLIVINENLKLETLFEKLQGVCLKLERWIFRLQESAVHRKGFQDLLDIGESVIKNHICILDHTFKLLAYTKNIECVEENVVNIINRGYHTEDVIQKLEKARHFEYYRHTEEILIDKTFDVAKYYTAEKVYIYKNDFSVQVVMTCCGADLTKAQLDLFEILLPYIQIYVDEVYRSEGQNDSYTSFFQELLENKKEIDVQAIERRSVNAKIDYEGNFVTFCISFGDAENIPYHYVVKKVVDILPDARIVIFNKDIVCLNRFHKISSGQLKQCLKYLQPVLEQYCADCGVSCWFFKLHELYRSYRQAKLAITYGKMGEVKNFCEGHKTYNAISFFDSCYQKFMIGTIYDKEGYVLQNTECMKKLYVLHENDHHYNTEYMKILYHYLMNERSPSKAAEALHMHRNNVVYHINKIKELISLDLDDSQERLNLVISYYLFQYAEYENNRNGNL